MVVPMALAATIVRIEAALASVIILCLRHKAIVAQTS